MWRLGGLGRFRPTLGGQIQPEARTCADRREREERVREAEAKLCGAELLLVESLLTRRNLRSGVEAGDRNASENGADQQCSCADAPARVRQGSSTDGSRGVAQRDAQRLIIERGDQRNCGVDDGVAGGERAGGGRGLTVLPHADDGHSANAFDGVQAEDDHL